MTANEPSSSAHKTLRLRKLACGVACVLGLVPAGCQGSGAAGRATPAAGGAARGRDAVVATVGARVVTAGDLEAAILRKHYGRMALLGLVREELFRQEATRLGVRIPEEKIAAQVAVAIDLLAGGLNASPEERAKALARRDLDPDALGREVRGEIENTLLVEAVVKAQRRIGAEDLMALYERTWKEPRLRVRHIAFPFGIAGDPAPEVVEAKRQQALATRSELERGADFAALARSRSGHPETAPRGGVIGEIQPQTLDDAELTARLFELTVGVTSEPIREGNYGWHVFRVDERLERRPLAEVEAELRTQLAEAAPSLEEISLVEEVLRSRTPVKVFDDVFERSASDGRR